MATVTAVTSTAQNPGLTTVRMSVCIDNPAASMFRDTESSSRGYVSVVDDHYGDASRVQWGTGVSAFSVGAETWMPLDSLQTVWGDASFTSGHRHDVKWTNAVDMNRVGPYVIGDADGGNLSEQIYDFGGGYARRLGRRLTLGVLLGYRAQIDYRNRDPRLKAIVSDFDLSAGASYCIGHGMMIVAGVSYNLYNQDDDVDFYSVNNVIRSYPLTGLGTVYSRFAGMSGETSTAYEGNGWGVNVALMSVDPRADRLAFTASMENRTTRMILRDYNDLELTSLDANAYAVGLSRPVALGNVRLMPEATAVMTVTEGTENLFGSAVGNEYLVIGSRQTYRHEVLSAMARVGVDWKLSQRTTVSASPTVTFDHDMEEMTAADRRLAFNAITPGLVLDWSQQWNGLWSSCLTLTAATRMAEIDTERLTGLDRNDAIGAMIVDDFNFMTSDATTLGGNISLDRKLKGRVSLTLNLGCRFTRVTDHSTRRHLYSSLSVNF